jgi:hypothetical protein
MSDTIPTFRLGQAVRIMQTDRMVALDLANKTGRVCGFDKDSAGDILLLSEIKIVRVHAHSCSLT